MNGALRARQGRPIKRTEKVNTCQEGTLEGERRATFIVKERSLELVKAIALFENRKIKDVINDALEGLLERKGEKFLQKLLANMEIEKD